MSARLRLGDVLFDRDRRGLYRGARELHVSPKAFRLLELLLERRPGAVPRADIQDALWPGTFVSDGSIAILVHELRKALGDTARRPRWIRTVFGFGYVLEGDVRGTEEPRPVPGPHAVSWAGRLIALTDGENILGRDPAAAVFVGHPSVSRHHARIVVEGSGARLEDLGSKNGTWLGGQRVTGHQPLRDGDEVILGSATLVYRGAAVGGSRDTETLR